VPTFFFFQAEDGIRDFHVTGVQTCALPISGVISVTSGPTSERSAATSCGEHTRARAPAPTASTARRRTASEAGPRTPTASSAASDRKSDEEGKKEELGDRQRRKR